MKLYMKESEDFEQYTYIKSKTVYDYDGFTTEYTMYYDEVNDRYVFVFGDSDFYNPNDGYEEFDWECDTEQEANEWFENYKGYEDDLDESICKESMKDIITDKLIALNLSFEEFADFVDSFGERTSTKTICKQIMKKFKFTYEEAKWILENWFAVDDLDESLKEDIEDTEDVYDLSPKEIVGLIKDMLSKIKFKPVDLEQSVFNEDGTDTYYLVFDKIYKALGSNFYTETNYPIEISKTPILFKENNRGTISMLFINAGRIWKITKNGKVTTEAINPYSKKDTLIYIYNQLKELKGSSLGESLKENVNKKYNWFLVNGSTVSVLPEKQCNSIVEDFVINMLFDEVVTDESDEDLYEEDPEKFYQKYDVEEQIRAAKYDLTQEGNGLKTSDGYIIMKDSNYEGDLVYGYYIKNGYLYNSRGKRVGKLENSSASKVLELSGKNLNKIVLKWLKTQKEIKTIKEETCYYHVYGNNSINPIVFGKKFEEYFRKITNYNVSGREVNDVVQGMDNDCYFITWSNTNTDEEQYKSYSVSFKQIDYWDYDHHCYPSDYEFYVSIYV